MVPKCCLDVQFQYPKYHMARNKFYRRGKGGIGKRTKKKKKKSMSKLKPQQEG